MKKKLVYVLLLFTVLNIILICRQLCLDKNPDFFRKTPTDYPVQTKAPLPSATPVIQPTDSPVSIAPSMTPTTLPTTLPTPSVYPEASEAPAQSLENTVSLCLMGDLMCLAGQQYTAQKSDGSHDYTGCFSLVSELFQSCDFVIGNLETTLSESNPYSTLVRKIDNQPNCNAPADYLDSLRKAGLTHLVTANNHCLDGSLTGITETIENLERYHFPHVGTYRESYDGAHYMLLEKNGFRIAILSFTELLNRRDSVAPETLSIIADCYSRQAVATHIQSAKAAGADFVIVFNHWGSENTHEVRSYQLQHAKEIAEAGADLIIGSHPHCLQPMERITTTDGRIVPCYYSLGNVISSMTRDINHDTVFVLLTLARNDSGSIHLEGHSLYPCHVLKSLNGHSLVLTPVDYPVEDTEKAAELSAAKERIHAVFQLKPGEAPTESSGGTLSTQ